MPTRSINHVTIAYDDHPGGDPLLFIHGIFMSRKQWQRQVAELSPRYRVITVDLRGHGESEASPQPYSVSLFAGDIIALLDELGLQRVVCCGHSFGGMVAQELALSYPDRLRGLILAETLYGACPNPWDVVWAGLMNRWLPQVIDLKTQVELFAWYFGLLTPGGISAIRRETRRYLQDEADLRNILTASMQYDSRRRLPQIVCPTLLLVAQFPQVPQVYQQAYEMAWRIRQARLKIIPGAGHMLH